MPTTININPEDGNSAVTKIEFGTSSPKLSGTVDLAPFENLLEFRGFKHDITEITGYVDNPNIQVMLISQNKLSGPIPDITGMTSLQYFWIMVNNFTGPFPDLNGLTNLRLINCGSNQLTGTIPTDLQSLGITLLDRFNAYDNSFTGAIPDFTGINAVTYCLVNDNNLTDFTGTVPPTLYRFFANNNNLTQTAVDNILQAFVDANRTTGMANAYINLAGSGNSPPSAAGVTNKNTLIGRGWTVTTN